VRFVEKLPQQSIHVTPASQPLEIIAAVNCTPGLWDASVFAIVVFMGSSNSSRTVAFVVDDEDVIASTLELILLSRGFAVRSFVDPADAAEAARLTRPDFLLTDVMMPKLNGIELALKMREINPDCCVLLFSGQAGTSDLLARASEQGHSFDILAKPVHPLDLLSKIAELLGETMPPPHTSQALEAID
jgi:DNA-binding response OmpR family regulator